MSKDLKLEWARMSKSITDSFQVGGLTDILSKDVLAQMGIKLWKHSYQNTDDDQIAFTNIIRYLTDNIPSLALLAGSPDTQIILSWCAKWADCAFPHIVLGHKIASAFMATNANPDLINDVFPPWKALLITIPSNLIFVEDYTTKQQVSMDMLSIQQIQNERGNIWNWRLSSQNSPLQLWRFGLTTDLLASTDMSYSDQELGELFGKDITDKDERIAQLIGRLIIGICLSFPEHNKSVGKGSKLHNKSKGYNRDSNGPIMRTYEIRSPITIDCRNVIKDYITFGNRKHSSSPNIQTLVRGCWRRPPFGIAKGLPKTIHIEPYWRGPEDAKILVRSHVIKEDK